MEESPFLGRATLEVTCNNRCLRSTMRRQSSSRKLSHFHIISGACGHLRLNSHSFYWRANSHFSVPLHVLPLPSLTSPCSAILSQRQAPSRASSTIADNAGRQHERIYFPNIEVENLEEYRVGGYHPTVVGDTFHEGRYEIVHKLGFGSYSTIWLARD